jgi:hypothetical protein
MSKLTVELPEHLKLAAVAAAAQGGFSVDTLVALAVAEKLSALRTVEHLRKEGAAGRREDFDRFLAAVPDREPAETDHLPE